MLNEKEDFLSGGYSKTLTYMFSPRQGLDCDKKPSVGTTPKENTWFGLYLKLLAFYRSGESKTFSKINVSFWECCIRLFSHWWYKPLCKLRCPLVLCQLFSPVVRRQWGCRASSLGGVVPSSEWKIWLNPSNACGGEWGAQNYSSVRLGAHLVSNRC